LDRRVIVGLRPSRLEDAEFAPPGWPRIKAVAQVTEKLGSEVDVILPSRPRRRARLIVFHLVLGWRVYSLSRAA
jgi:hypothetical protein